MESYRSINAKYSQIPSVEKQLESPTQHPTERRPLLIYPSNSSKCNAPNCSIKCSGCQCCLGLTIAGMLGFGVFVYVDVDCKDHIESHPKIQKCSNSTYTGGAGDGITEAVKPLLADTTTQRKLLNSDFQVESVSDFPIRLQEQLQNPLTHGVLLTFVSTITKDGLKKMGCTENQITTLGFLVNFLVICAVKGDFFEDFLSILLQCAVSTTIPSIVEYVKNRSPTLSAAVAVSGTLANLYHKPPETLASLVGSTLGFLAAKTSSTVVDYYYQKKPITESPGFTV
jgi:hypothetical protein